MSKNTATITADAIWHARRHVTRYATSDKGASYSVIASTSVGPIVESARTQQLARLVRTGNTVDRGGQVRVRIEFAHDTGDRAGTLAFGASSIGGRCPADVFDRSPR